MSIKVDRAKKRMRKSIRHSYQPASYNIQCSIKCIYVLKNFSHFFCVCKNIWKSNSNKEEKNRIKTEHVIWSERKNTFLTVNIDLSVVVVLATNVYLLLPSPAPISHSLCRSLIKVNEEKKKTHELNVVHPLNLIKNSEIFTFFIWAHAVAPVTGTTDFFFLFAEG